MDTPYKELTLSAQLNSDADYLATTYLQENPDTDHTQAPLFPKAECALHLPQGTITRDYQQILRNTRNDQNFKSKLCAQHSWGPQVLDSVDWTAHAQALRRYEKRRPTFVKYLHDLLPIGKRIYKYNPKYPPTCPSCQAPDEDIAHFWQCPAPHRRAWRQTFLTALEARMLEMRTKRHVRILLLQKLECIIEGRDHTTLVIAPEVEDLCQAQDIIGWNQILKGRFSRMWTTNSTFPSQQLKHTNWTVEIIDCIFANWWLLWEIRNKDRHGHNNTTRAQASSIQVQRELQQFYDRFQRTAPQTLQWLFDMDLETRSQWSTNKVWQWLNTWQPVLATKTRPLWAPSNSENYPYQTRLETG